jgi:tRNA threonylcarbamoyladenosine biosynthesis protein TsaB
LNIVAIETATETVGVAVRTTDGMQAQFSLSGRRRHVESLVPAMEHLLAQVGIDAISIDAVAVDLGPGLFTGLRVGVSTAKALAQSLGIGIVGLSSLDILFEAAREVGHRGLVLSVVDARRGEVFAALREVGSEGGEAAEVFSPSLFSPGDLTSVLSALGGVPVVAVGDGAQRYADVLRVARGVTCVMGALSSPPASTLLSLASDRLAAGTVPDLPNVVVPIYMREADARINFAQIDRASGLLPAASS